MGSAPWVPGLGQPGLSPWSGSDLAGGPTGLGACRLPLKGGYGPGGVWPRAPWDPIGPHGAPQGPVGPHKGRGAQGGLGKPPRAPGGDARNLLARQGVMPRVTFGAPLRANHFQNSDFGSGNLWVTFGAPLRANHFQKSDFGLGPRPHGVPWGPGPNPPWAIPPPPLGAAD